jgi:hypothetical protein
VAKKKKRNFRLSIFKFSGKQMQTAQKTSLPYSTKKAKELKS